MFKTIACLVALAAAVPAAAESRLVRYDDLNLSSPAGIERLERRIDGAARQVCGLRYDFRQSLIVQAATKKCMVEAKANAMAKVAQLETSATRGG